MNVRDNRRHSCDGGGRRGATLLAIVAMAAVAGCAPSATAPTAHVTNTTTPPPPVAPTASPTPSDPLAGCASPLRFSALHVVGRLSNADDVVSAPDGSIWVSDAASTLVHMTLGGSVLQRIADARAPEGLVVRADGSLLVAEQQPDRVVLLQPQTLAVRTVVQLTPRAGQAGVDGIGYDPSIDALLVPDSPNGTLLEVPVSGGTATRLASGLGRPVDVAMVEDGGFVVTAENATGLYRIPARGGTASPIPGVSDADDVVVAGTLAYVTSLSSHELLAIDLATLRTRVLVTGDESPQGLAQLSDGTLVLTDSTTGTMATVPGCA